jgi:hypothetical protein
MFVSRAEEAGAAAITKLMCNVCDRRGVEAEADHALERISGLPCPRARSGRYRTNETQPQEGRVCTDAHRLGMIVRTRRMHIQHEDHRRRMRGFVGQVRLAPPGQLRVACDTIVADSGKPDRVDLSAEQHAVPGSYFGWVSCLSWRGACGWRLIGLTCSLADSGPGASGHDHLGNVG